MTLKTTSDTKPFAILWISFSILFCFLSLVAYFEPNWIVTRSRDTSLPANDDVEGGDNWNDRLTVDRVATFGINQKCSDLSTSIFGHSETCFGSAKNADDVTKLNDYFYWSWVCASAATVGAVSLIGLITLRVCLGTKWVFVLISVAHLLSALCFAATVVLYLIGYTKGREEHPHDFYSLFGYCSALDSTFPFMEETDFERDRCSVSWAFVIEAFLCLGNFGLFVVAMINAVAQRKEVSLSDYKKQYAEKLSFSSISSGFNRKSLSLDRDLISQKKPKKPLWKTTSIKLGKLKRGSSMSFKPNFANQPDKPETRQETFDIPDISITGVSNNRGKFRLRNRSPLVSVSQEFDDAMLETNEQIENYVIDSNKVVNRETKKQNSFGSEKSESRRSQMNVQIEEF